MRVLMGDFDALYRLGLREILDRDGAQVVEAGADRLLERLIDTLPHVVVMDADKATTAGVAAAIVRDFPAIRVVACSSKSPVMRVYPAFHGGESYLTSLDPALLEREILL